GIIIPLKQEILPFEDRLRKAPRVSVFDERLHVIVRLSEVSVLLVLLQHRVVDPRDGEEYLAGAQGGFTLGIRIEDDSVRRDNNAAIRVLPPQQRQFLADVRRKKRFTQIQVKQLLQTQIVDEVGHARQSREVHWLRCADARG